MLEFVCVPGGRAPLLKSLKKVPAWADSVAAVKNRPTWKYRVRDIMVIPFIG